MALVITITPTTLNNPFGGTEDVKLVTCEINGAKITEEYSYPQSTADATIESEVEADLTAKGYTWT